ncbi:MULTISPECIES: alpha/beta fold hydrolase [unclassified Streptomyces]|uniref:alpha/beta fold hydrolase n=1 Tax=unclassified Streptomyces TaxID=2593676 RepID=UPI00224E91A5|nr:MULTISPECIES: alpha/beta hydrolase [unclassified Streptomyces]WSP53499.1 alpha/beta hydrolase [Streptomyces sp. NBC_01241]WSU25832.1 alpha/beta hydrolase [Streptomyces sp. NBC_01108]MCX4784878.1 alpha/beta hydrolase [Streptomyces sp. NBC_01221]MCX4799169.1 alpha/beta hydrolase [Streptomyces sp. NBC_01242]WSJ40359.1 alpha/beta hydrolase [Streptomyces sp. NBC_01321]
MTVSTFLAPRRRIRGRRAQTLAAALTTAALTTAPVPAAAADGGDPAAAKPTVVLVHGAFADASGWNGVVERLKRHGYQVTVPVNPLRGLAGDSASLAAVLKTIKGPIVLAGHSYGGAVIGNAAAGNPNVTSLVYVSAFMPDKGEGLADLGTKFAGSDLNTALKPVPTLGSDGKEGTDLYIRSEKFHDVFAADVPPDTAAALAAAQHPISGAAFMDKATAAAWRTIPSWALVATRDKAIAPDLERFEAKRAKSHTIEVDSSHAAMISHPDVVADLIRQAAGDRTPADSPMAPTGTSRLVLTSLGALAGVSILTGAGLAAAARRRRAGAAGADGTGTAL